MVLCKVHDSKLTGSRLQVSPTGSPSKPEALRPEPNTRSPDRTVQVFGFESLDLGS